MLEPLPFQILLDIIWYLEQVFLNDKLEFNSNFTLQSDKVAFKNVFTSDYYTLQELVNYLSEQNI